MLLPRSRVPLGTALAGALVAGVLLTATQVAAADGAVGASSAGTTRTPTTVTIQARGTNLSGTVRSSAAGCADGRLVVLVKQIGARGGGDDIRFSSDDASLQGTTYTWSTGDTGTPGRFYAKVRRTETCGFDTSPTVRAVRSDG
jgi:hypothetical protein